MMSLITDHPVTVILHCVYRLHSPAAADRATQGPSDLFPQKLICGLHKQATELWQMEKGATRSSQNKVQNNNN